MIVKVAPNRRDGQSSFEDLGGYITEGIGQSGDSEYRSSWDKLTQYITKESVLDALGNDVEKTIAVEIGNVTSLATAASEMCAVANNNPRAENPVYHYILSWPEHERPDVQDVFGAARHTLKALGLHEHQYIIAIHGNTDHIHAHIEVNRVHPETYKATHIEWAHKTLHKAAREAELQYGWSHDNGLYSVVEVGGHKHVVENRLYKDGDRAPAKGRSADFEVWSGEQSLETWCRGAPAAALKELLTDPAVSSWQDIHRTLAKFGLVLQDSGGGGMKVGLSDNSQDTGRPLTVSASKAFRFMKRKDLVDRFGAFMKPESSVSVDVIPVTTSTGKTEKTPVTTYKRDPEKRLDRRLARQALRDDLRSRFREEQSKARDLHARAKQVFKETFAELSDSRLAAFHSEVALKRAAIQKAQMLAPQKRNAYALLNLAARQEKSRLFEELRVERDAHKKLLPPLLVWRDWVADLATQGDEAAISALRGLVYQDRRDLKKTELDGTGDPLQPPVPPSSMPDRKEENAIWAASRQAHSDPVVLALQNLVWRVTTTGRVAYSFKSGERAFTDAGNRLTFDRVAVTDDALIASLAYARERFGESVRISGGDRVFQERAAKLAVRIGMKVSNPDLQHLMHATPETKQHPFNTSARSFRGRLQLPRLSLHADDLVPPPPHHSNLQSQVAAARPLHPFIDLARNPNGRTIFEPYSLRVGGQEPPPAARAGLRTLSSIDLVRHENPEQGKADRSQELLPSVVSGVLEVRGTDNNRGMRWAVPSNEGLIASRLKDMDPVGVLRAPDTSRGTYAGPIVLVTDESVVQAVGRHEYVSHSRVGMSGVPPVVGSAVKINYKNGVCSMSTTKRDRGGRK